MSINNARPPDIYVKLSIDGNSTREYMSVFRQKAPGSDEFICISCDTTPIGQHMIDFLRISNEALPSLTSKMRNNLNLIQSQNFDHHLVPVCLASAFEVYNEIRRLHSWWSSSLPLEKLWSDFNDYSFYSQHPSPYLIETYDEVDRLMNEEFYWNVVCDQLHEYLKWLEFYTDKLSLLGDALVCCLDSSQADVLTRLSNTQRAFLFRSFFDDQFLDRSPINLLYNLHEKYSSPLGKTLKRDRILRPDSSAFLEHNGKNMDFKSVISGTDAIQLESLVKLIEDKQLEFTRELILQDPSDIYSACCLDMYLMIANDIHIKKCKNCGNYFVPLNRSDEQYCCRVQSNGKMCRELDYEEKINADTLLTIYRTAYKTHNARKRRNQNNKVNAEKEFNEWVSFAKRLLERAKAGEISAQEFQELIKK